MWLSQLELIFYKKERKNELLMEREEQEKKKKRYLNIYFCPEQVMAAHSRAWRAIVRGFTKELDIT